MSNINIDTDKPIESPGDDLLSRDFFASRITKMLSDRSANNNISVALYGGPGSGKTSLLNLIEIQLNNSIKKSRKKNRVVIRFNPWLAGDIVSIRRDYFAQLVDIFTSVSTKNAAQLANDIDGYFSALTDFHNTESDDGQPKGEGDILTNIGLMEVKKELSKKLDASDYRIYILIDDIDKLREENLLAFIHFITAFADLPGIINLLAFDDKYVADILADGDTNAGWEALDKIVQVGFDVPRVDKNRINDIFFDAIFGILKPYDISEKDKSEIINSHRSGMEYDLSNLRSIKRFLNSLVFHLPIVAGEVNIPDFFGLDFLRVFHPEIYFDIYKHRNSLVGPTDSGTAGMPVEKAYGDIRSLWADAFEVKPPVITLCARLFPRVSYVFEAEEYGTKLEINWIKGKRICSDHYFDKYFTFAAPAGKLSDKEFSDIIKLILDEKKSDALLPLVEKGRIRDYFDRLIWTSDEFDDEAIVILAKTAFEIGDMTKIDSRGAPEIAGAHTADYTCWWLLKQLPKSRQLDILNEVLAEKSSLQTILKYIRDRVITTYMGNPEFAAADIDKLKKAAIARISSAVKEMELPDNPDLISILFAWRDIEGEETPTAFLNNCFGKSDIAVKALERFAIYSHITDPSRKYLTRVEPTFDFRALDVLTDIETVANRLIELSVDIENEDDIKIIEDFIRLYNDYTISTDGVPSPPAAPEGFASTSAPKEPPPIPPDKLG